MNASQAIFDVAGRISSSWTGRIASLAAGEVNGAFLALSPEDLSFGAPSAAPGDAIIKQTVNAASRFNIIMRPLFGQKDRQFLRRSAALPISRRVSGKTRADCNRLMHSMKTINDLRRRIMAAADAKMR